MGLQYQGRVALTGAGAYHAGELSGWACTHLDLSLSAGHDDPLIRLHTAEVTANAQYIWGETIWVPVAPGR